jgi:hypothetical protein
MNDTSKSFPLLVLASAKNSAAYWTDTANIDLWESLCDSNYIIGGSGGLFKYCEKPPQPEKGKTLKVVEADAIGMAAGSIGGLFGGAIVGAVIGSFAGPAGTAAGAAGGALIGSMGGMISVGTGNSVTEVCKQQGNGK